MKKIYKDDIDSKCICLHETLRVTLLIRFSHFCIQGCRILHGINYVLRYKKDFKIGFYFDLTKPKVLKVFLSSKERLYVLEVMENHIL